MPRKISVKIKRMSKNDIDKVIELASQIPELRTGTNASQFYSKQTLQRWCNDRNGAVFVAYVSNELAGFILGYYMQGTRDGYLNAIAVKPKCRGSDIGKKLLISAIKKFKESGCNHIFAVVKSDNNALEFFKKKGFELGQEFRYVEKML